MQKACPTATLHSGPRGRLCLPLFSAEPPSRSNTSVGFFRLPVRPKTRTSQAHHREIGSPELKNRNPPKTKTVHGETVYVSNWPSHRTLKAGSIRTSAHEAHSVPSKSTSQSPLTSLSPFPSPFTGTYIGDYKKIMS